MELLGLVYIPVWLQWLLVIGGALYWYSNRNSNYWKKHEFVHEPAASFYTILRSLLTKSLPELEIERYKKYGRLYGGFLFSKPTLTVADPDLLKDILVKDFHVFPFRRDFKLNDPIGDNMVSILKGENWKRVRTTITPAFTSRKMRKIASIINDSAKTTVQNFLAASEKGENVDCKRIFGAFTMDVIASTAFATKIDSHNDPNNPFVSHAREAFTGRIWMLLLFILFPPSLWTKLQKLVSMDHSSFFRDVTLQVIEERKKRGIRGNDFLQLMMDAAKEDLEINQTIDGFKLMDVEEEDEEEEEDLGHGKENKNVFKIDYTKSLTRDELVAQCVLFFMVGYETTAATLAFCAYNLAVNPDCQEKLIKEVDEAFEKNGEMTYEVVRDMKYLGYVISETLRMHPSLIRSERTAIEDYKLGDTGFTVPKGMVVGFPIYAIHHDPEFYPDPEKFDPYRFLPENQHDRPAYAYLPFGAGPRNCLGMRFALMEIKLCVANALRHLRFRKCPETKVPLEYKLALGFLQPKSLLLAVEKRKDVAK